VTRRTDRRPEAEQFGAAIRHLRESKGLSCYQLADMAGVSFRYVYALEAGDNNPSLTMIFSLCEALGTTPATLLDPIWRQRKR